MAGHSKWANIQHRKGAQDKKRGKAFTKIIREITVASRMGGGDPDANPRLRAAVEKAYSSNMSKDTVERAIKRGAGGAEDANVEEIIYEGYGPSGVAFLVHCLTDNRNRAVAEVRYVFTKMGGNLGTSGSVAYLFSEKGQLVFPPGADEEKIMEISIENDAEDVAVGEDHSIEVITSPENFTLVKDALIAAGFEPAYSEVGMTAATTIALDDETREKIQKAIDALEDLDDVQDVSTNAAL